MHDLPYRTWMTSLRYLGSALLHLGYRLDIEGAEHAPPEGAALVLHNHVTFHDWLFVGIALRRPPRFVMHHHHFKYPLLRAFFGASRVIPIAPKKENAAMMEAALEAIDAALANGEVVVMCPEGRMTEDGALGTFRPGLERIVARRPVPVVPVALTGLFGTYLSRCPGPLRVRPSVKVHLSHPLAPEDVSVERVRERIEQMLEGERLAQRNGPQRPAPVWQVSL